MPISCVEFRQDVEDCAKHDTCVNPLVELIYLTLMDSGLN